MIYLVSENLEVSIYNESQEEPIIFQPYYPDGTPFNSEADASAWAEQWIYDAENYVPPVEPTE